MDTARDLAQAGERGAPLDLDVDPDPREGGAVDVPASAHPVASPRQVAPGAAEAHTDPAAGVASAPCPSSRDVGGRNDAREQAGHAEQAAESGPTGDDAGSTGPALSAGEPTRARRPRVDPALVDGLWDAYFAAPGDATRNRLVEAYQGLARDIARRFGARLPRSVDRGDLQTAASFGLIHAVEGFDPERGVRFESYCELRVKGALLDELRSQDWLPRPWRQRIEQQKRATEKLRSSLGRPPADDEVAAELGLGLDVYLQTFGIGLPGTPLGSMPGDEADEDGGPALDVVPDPSIEAPGDRLSREELLALVSQKLTEQESRIVYLKYWEELPMREIGELTGLSESRVCKIHTRLIERLQDRFRVHLDED